MHIYTPKPPTQRREGLLWFMVLNVQSAATWPPDDFEGCGDTAHHGSRTTASRFALLTVPRKQRLSQEKARLPISLAGRIPNDATPTRFHNFSLTPQASC